MCLLLLVVATHAVGQAEAHHGRLAGLLVNQSPCWCPPRLIHWHW
jgi:hypothetical protein